METLRGEIETSFRLAGIEGRAWLAEDIALAIEASLCSFGRDCVLSLSEIDSIVEGVLRDAGFIDAAAEYRGLSLSSGRDGILVERDRLASVIAGAGGIVGNAELAELAKRVSKALGALSISHAPLSLILELARFYRFHGESSPVLVGSTGDWRRGAISWIVSAESVLERVGENARRLMDIGVLSFPGVSVIFPEIKIGVDIAALARDAGLIPPTAEFVLYPLLEDVGQAVADMADVAWNLMAATGIGVEGERAPLRLRAVSPARFAEEWLCGGWPESAGCVAELLAEVAGSVDGEVMVDVR